MKFLLMFLFAFSAFAFNPAMQNIQQLPEEQRELKTIADYKELEALLVQVIRTGDKSKAMALATLYNEKHELEDGIVPADKVKAKQYFEVAAEYGIGLAMYQLALNEIEAKRYYEALLLLEDGLRAKYNNPSSRVVIATAHSSLVLDEFSTDKKLAIKSSALLEGAVKEHPVLTSAFVLANVMHVAGNDEKANYYLNVTCNTAMSKKDDYEGLKKMCMNTMGIEVDNAKNCETCPTKRRLGN